MRIEDLDTARVVPGCADQMLRTLEAYGFEWDGEVLYQSTRREAYRAALAQLTAAGRLFACSCSRKDLAVANVADGDDQPQGYPGNLPRWPDAVRGPDGATLPGERPEDPFDDLFLGSQEFDLATCGDVVVERRDGLTSYQLAVVVDDAFQEVTRVVRGADLLPARPGRSTSRTPLRCRDLATAICRWCWNRTAPNYPSRTARYRSTLSAVPQALTSTLTLLSQAPPPELAPAPIKDVWNWAVAHWNPQALAGRTRASLSAAGDTKAVST